MKILKNAGSFEVLTKPENVINDIASSARTCYQSQDKSTPENDLKLVRNLMKREHFAMFEFSNMNVRFSNVSRGFTHEMVRHRLASFAQESTRYVKENDLHVIVPPHKNENEFYPDLDNGILGISLSSALEVSQNAYRTLLKAGWKLEDARQVLPIATQAQIVVGANIREWRHIFKMRCDIFAHWEIRSVMLNLLRWCRENIPVVFEDFKFFKTDSGEEYARIVMTESNIAEKIIENGNIENIINKLPEEIQKRIYWQLEEGVK
jgi:thymidylate synthase (FAD)